MTRFTAPITALALLMACAGTSQAQTPAEQHIDQRQERQQQRIDQGLKSGELTRPEARRLERQQHGVDRAEQRALSDGRMSKQEAARIEHRQDRGSARIYRQKHDRQARPAGA
jgi:hypothetical protein